MSQDELFATRSPVMGVGVHYKSDPLVPDQSILTVMTFDAKGVIRDHRAWKLNGFERDYAPDLAEAAVNGFQFGPARQAFSNTQRIYQRARKYAKDVRRNRAF